MNNFMTVFSRRNLKNIKIKKMLSSNPPQDSLRSAIEIFSVGGRNRRKFRSCESMPDYSEEEKYT